MKQTTQIFLEDESSTLNISDFSLFCIKWKLQPPWKMSPSLSQQPPLKVEVLPTQAPSSSLKIWMEGQPPSRKGLVGGTTAHYVKDFGKFKKNHL